MRLLRVFFWIAWIAAFLLILFGVFQWPNKVGWQLIATGMILVVLIVLFFGLGRRRRE